MFPLNDGNLPAFEELDTSDLIQNQAIEDLLNKLVIGRKIDLETIEINAFLTILKKEYYKIANDFITATIGYYFSHPQVLIKIQDGRKTLFPNPRVLPDINFDLLIPVMEKEYENV